MNEHFPDRPVFEWAEQAAAKAVRFIQLYRRIAHSSSCFLFGFNGGPKGVSFFSISTIASTASDLRMLKAMIKSLENK